MDKLLTKKGGFGSIGLGASAGFDLSDNSQKNNFIS